MTTTDHIIERYRRARERLKHARGGEDETERFQAEIDGLWRAMSDADRRTVLGVGEGMKRAA